MKKAKIMLLSITVVAVIGGALAFKAQRFVDKNVYCASVNNQNKIYCTLSDFKIVLLGPAVSTPCLTWHNALSLGAGFTSSYYTTTEQWINGELVICPNPMRANVTSTNVP